VYRPATLNNPAGSSCILLREGAALEDLRFEPVRPDELGEISIEISVLSPLNKIVPDQIEAGKHGLLVRQGERQGVLLPQVATQFGWTGIRFLQETCAKAGLQPDAWKDSGTEIQAFTAETFTESAMEEASPGEIPGEAIA
jgi:AmmeMemoRadiSam system protein A